MKKTSEQRDQVDDMLPEYNPSGRKGIRGKYYKRYRQGVSVTIHRKNQAPLRYKEISLLIDADIAKVFRTSEEINAALRAVIAALPKRAKNSRA